MSYKPQIKIPATYMRGGTSKGVFFKFDDLPQNVKSDKALLDKLLLRVIGSPDPYKKHTDGMGGATSSTSKAVIISKSLQPDHDIDYYFAQVSIDKPFIDWSGNCGNLSSAVGPFAIRCGFIPKERLIENGTVCVRVYQANIKKTILCHVPIKDGFVQEIGDYEIDGVAFPSAEIKLEFLDPVDENEELFPTGNLIDKLEVPGIGTFEVTMITAGIPIIFLKAKDLGYSGTELQSDINSNEEALEMFEKIRAYGALKMGLINDLNEAKTRAHTPKIAIVAPPKNYTASSGKEIKSEDIDLNVRALSMGQLHHAMMGTASVAIGVAASIEGTLVNQACGGIKRESVVFGHPSGTMKVGAKIVYEDSKPKVKRAILSRSARVIMEGNVFVPADTLL